MKETANQRTPLYPWAPEIYNEMMSPIKTEPIMKRAWKPFFWELGLSISWPITAPGSILWALSRNLRGKGDFTDQYVFLGCLGAPYTLATQSKGLLTKRTVAQRFSNIDKLVEDGTVMTKPDGVNPGIGFGEDSEKGSPYRFEEWLKLIFPDNLALDDFSADYYATANRENPGNLYLDCNYFLRVNPEDTQRLYEEVKNSRVVDLRK